MITVNQVMNAIKLITEPTRYLFATATEKQLAQSLELYEDRGEFDGSFDSAIACLTLAGYEIELN